MAAKRTLELQSESSLQMQPGDCLTNAYAIKDLLLLFSDHEISDGREFNASSRQACGFDLSEL